MTARIVLVLTLCAALLADVHAQVASGEIVCGGIDLTPDAKQLCSEVFGLEAAGKRVSFTLSADASQIQYTSSEGAAVDVTRCTRANLNLTGQFVLGTGAMKYGFTRSGDACVPCPSRTFCQDGTPLLEECPCEACSRGSSFAGNISDPMSTLRCARCPFTCSSLGVEIMPTGGDTCFICNEELSIPNFDQNNCLTLEGWWVEQPISLENLRSFVKAGPRMLFADRIKRCYPNPDAPVQTILDSLELRERGGEVETIGSHCRRNSLIYPTANFSTAFYEVDDRCNDPSTGALCLGCELGFTKRGSYFGNCTECGDLDVVGIGARIVFNIWIVVASVYFTLRTESDYRRNKSEPGNRSLRWTVWKIFLSHMQMLSAFAFVSIPWEESMLMLIKGGEYLAVSRIDLSCLYPETFFSQELIYILVFWVAMLLFTFIAVFFHHLCHKRGCDVCALQQKNLNAHIDLDLLSSRITAALVAAVIAMHFLCTSITLQLLSCISVDFGNNQLSNSWLLKDPKLQCWTGELGIWQYAVGIPVLVLLLFVIPIYLCWLIRKRRFAFLTYFYKEQHAYWDVVVLWRKILFLCAVVLLTDYGEAVETSNAAIVLGLSLALHCYYLPYATPLANLLDGLGLLVLMFTLSIGTFQSSAKVSSVSRIACNVFIIVVNVIYGLVFLIIVGLDFIKPKVVAKFNARTSQALDYLFPRSQPSQAPAKTMIIEDTDIPKDENSAAFREADVSISQLRGNVLGIQTQTPRSVPQHNPDRTNNEHQPNLHRFNSSELLEHVNQSMKLNTGSEAELKEA